MQKVISLNGSWAAKRVFVHGRIQELGKGNLCPGALWDPLILTLEKASPVKTFLLLIGIERHFNYNVIYAWGVSAEAILDAHLWLNLVLCNKSYTSTNALQSCTNQQARKICGKISSGGNFLLTKTSKDTWKCNKRKVRWIRKMLRIFLFTNFIISSEIADERENFASE